MIIARPDEDLRNADWLHGKQDLAETVTDVRQALSEESRHAMFYRLTHPGERSAFSRAHGRAFHSIGTPTGHPLEPRSIPDLHPTKPHYTPLPDGIKSAREQERTSAYLQQALSHAGISGPLARAIGKTARGQTKDFEVLLRPIESLDPTKQPSPWSSKKTIQKVLYEKAASALSRASGDRVPHEDVMTFFDHWQGGERREPWGALQQAVSQHFNLPLDGVKDRTLGLKIDNIHFAPIAAVASELVPLQHAHTLAYYRSQGITHVDLYRGVAFEPGDHPGSWNGIGPDWESHQLEQAPLSSWTTSLQMASEFAGGHWGTSTTNPFAEQYILSVRVPVERILSNGITGLGAAWQGEHLVIGGVLDVAVRRMDS